jgi:hypothetical protein
MLFTELISSMPSTDQSTAMPNPTSALPPGFEALEIFVDYWGARTTQERWERRSGASMNEIRRFYDAVLARAGDIVKHLDPIPLHMMPEDAQRLACLLFSLANCAIAVELHKAPRAPYSPFPHGVRILKGASPLG